MSEIFDPNVQFDSMLLMKKEDTKLDNPDLYISQTQLVKKEIQDYSAKIKGKFEEIASEMDERLKDVDEINFQMEIIGHEDIV